MQLVELESCCCELLPGPVSQAAICLGAVAAACEGDSGSRELQQEDCLLELLFMTQHECHV